MKIEVLDLQSLFSVIEEQNLSIPEVIKRIKENGQIGPKLAGEINLTVDYSRTLDQMIAAGKYYWKDNNIAVENFPFPTKLSGKKTSVSAKLFHFNRNISSEDVISEMDKKGFRPATLAELLALGEARPDLQRLFPIVGLGSVWRYADGGRVVPGLGVDGDERGLSLSWFDGDWNALYRFLAVRK